MDVFKSFLITLFLPLFFSVLSIYFRLVVSPSIAHCPKFSFTSCNSECREVMKEALQTHTHKHACMKAGPLKALRQQKQQVVVCGLIGPAGCRIIALDMSDRSVSGTKCTDEFPVAPTKADLQIVWTFCAAVYSKVKWKAREMGGGVLLSVSRAVEVKSHTRMYIFTLSMW